MSEIRRERNQGERVRERERGQESIMLKRVFTYFYILKEDIARKYYEILADREEVRDRKGERERERGLDRCLQPHQAFMV